MSIRQKLSICKNPIVAVVSGLVLGMLVVLGVRFETYAPEHTHYHANFAVFINGKQEEFKNPKYYQEVAICSKSRGITLPEARAHLHDKDNSAIHIHDHAVTWGQFLNNIGWNIGNNFLVTDDNTVYQEAAENKLHIYINNQDYTGITTLTNTVIKDKDRLLISFGNQDDQTLLKEAKAVSNSAAKYDAGKDPGTCSKHEKPTFKERLQHLF